MGEDPLFQAVNCLFEARHFGLFTFRLPETIFYNFLESLRSPGFDPLAIQTGEDPANPGSDFATGKNVVYTVCSRVPPSHGSIFTSVLNLSHRERPLYDTGWYLTLSIICTRKIKSKGPLPAEVRYWVPSPLILSDSISTQPIAGTQRSLLRGLEITRKTASRLAAMMESIMQVCRTISCHTLHHPLRVCEGVHSALLPPFLAQQPNRRCTRSC